MVLACAPWQWLATVPFRRSVIPSLMSWRRFLAVGSFSRCAWICTRTVHATWLLPRCSTLTKSCQASPVPKCITYLVRWTTPVFNFHVEVKLKLPSFFVHLPIKCSLDGDGVHRGLRPWKHSGMWTSHGARKPIGDHLTSKIKTLMLLDSNVVSFFMCHHYLV